MTELVPHETSAPSASRPHADRASAILRRLATRAMGMTGADIERIVREARLKARRGKRPLRFEDLEEGIRGNRPPLPESLRWRLACHEAGHAVVHHALDLGHIRGISIDDPEGGYSLIGLHASGSATRDWYENMLTMLMAGRAAEKLALRCVSSGSGGTGESDLARATRLAFDMERTLGFGQELPLLYRPHRDPVVVLDSEKELAARVHAMLQTAQDRAENMLRQRRLVFYALANALFEALALDEAAVVQILTGGDPPP